MAQSCPLLALSSPAGKHVLAQLAQTLAERPDTCAARLLLNTDPAVFSGDRLRKGPGAVHA